MDVLIAMDSRGRGLYSRICTFYDGEFYVLSKSGYTIERMLDPILSIADTTTRHTIIQVGVNDLTTLRKGQVVFNFSNVIEMVSNLINKFELLLQDLGNHLPHMKITLCPLIGISLHRYNRNNLVYPEQAVINKGILEINKWIIFKNDSMGCKTPRLVQDIHKSKGKRRAQHRYSLLRKDGLHLTAQIKDIWSTELVSIM